MFVFRIEETNGQKKIGLFVGFSLFGQDHISAVSSVLSFFANDSLF